jgi:hypothetical protein
VANSLGNLFGRLLKRDSESGPGETRDGGGVNPQHGGAESRKDCRTPDVSQARVEWFDENGVCHSQPVTIRDTSAHGVAFTISEEFPVDQTVWIEADGSQITKTVVRHTAPKGRDFLTGAYRVDQERRRADRFPVAGEAVLHWGDSQVGPCDTPVTVRNATEFGLQVESAVPLPVGTIVQLIGDELQCDGSTCYCQEVGDKFVVGLHMVRQAYRRNGLDYKGDT